eukprot:TRINITY_DN1946_c0_g2_i2.p1 TRINITY_DN1946_c0_g2~~TRINITY_DN1946_c0_g2_i2.p1  ORF type:complete len:675 (-),score=121.75 TRINITY_DN1946_c0_g2_i2:1748-3772(-)
MGACLSSQQDKSVDKKFEKQKSTEEVRLTQQIEPKLRTDARVRDCYKLGRTLGTGGFAVVKLAVDKITGEEYACKIMALPPVGVRVGEDENSREDIFKEIDILCGLEHENVVYLKEYFEENNKVYLITELLLGGELLEAVIERGTYSEADARTCFVQLLRGIRYLHQHKIVHRDLKLENLLLAAPDDITHVKIADFGLAKKVAEQQMQTICGTPQYVAPEIIMGNRDLEYGPAVDMWSAGVVLFILLGGYPPFYHESEAVLFEIIRKGLFKFDDPVWEEVSDQAKDLISKLLVVNPNKRLSAGEALQHPWLGGVLSQSNLKGVRENMKRHMRSKWKGAIGTVMAVNRLNSLLEGIKEGSVQSGLIINDSEGYQQAVAAARNSTNKERNEKNQQVGTEDVHIQQSDQAEQDVEKVEQQNIQHIKEQEAEIDTTIDSNGNHSPINVSVQDNPNNVGAMASIEESVKAEQPPVADNNAQPQAESVVVLAQESMKSHQEGENNTLQLAAGNGSVIQQESTKSEPQVEADNDTIQQDTVDNTTQGEQATKPEQYYEVESNGQQQDTSEISGQNKVSTRSESYYEVESNSQQPEVGDIVVSKQESQKSVQNQQPLQIEQEYEGDDENEQEAESDRAVQKNESQGGWHYPFGSIPQPQEVGSGSSTQQPKQTGWHFQGSMK